MPHTPFDAIADPTRRRILDLLLTNPELNLKDITAHFEDITRQGIRKHLDMLIDADLVKTEKVGRQTICQLNPLPLQQVANWFMTYTHLWPRKYQQLSMFMG